MDDFLNRLHTVSACLVQGCPDVFGQAMLRTLSDTRGAPRSQGITRREGSERDLSLEILLSREHQIGRLRHESI